MTYAVHMANDLQAEVRAATDAFAKQLLQIFQVAVLGNLSMGARDTRDSQHAPLREKPGKRRRRSKQDVENLVGEIVRLVKRTKDGLRAEQIREELGIERKLLPRALATALADKKLHKKGQKRSTTYFAR